ncbi:MAG TPA: hypothetical protein PLP33_25270 [Leptospiraceae bacterium]|nr:hypothetical protein [Leptospiraceae bacterium]
MQERISKMELPTPQQLTEHLDKERQEIHDKITEIAAEELKKRFSGNPVYIKVEFDTKIVMAVLHKLQQTFIKSKWNVEISGTYSLPDGRFSTELRISPVVTRSSQPDHQTIMAYYDK